MPKMDLARRRFYRCGRMGQEIVGTMHAALGGRLLVLLNGHVSTPENPRL
jgi:hypothetical protein